MAKPAPGKISIREFARRLGVSDTAVHKAITAGRIVNGVTGIGRSREIDPKIAAEEWAANYNPDYGNRSKPLAEKLGTVTPTEPEAVADPAPPVSAGSKEDMSLANVKRMGAALKVKMMQIQLKTLEGDLVPKKAVYSALYAAGAEVRNAVLAVPDRVLDDLLACATRGEAHTKLHDALIEALNSVTNVLNRGI